MRREPVTPPDVLAAIRAPLSAFAPDLVSAPVLLPLSRLLDLAGEGMRAHLAVIDTGAEPMALRPDFTIAVAELHLATGQSEARYAYEGAAFTAGERDAAEFQQLGVEAYGANQADEWTMIRAAWDAAMAGGRQDLSMVLGGIGMFTAFLDAMNMARSVRSRLVRALADRRTLEDELDRAGDAAAPTSSETRLAGILSKMDEADAVVMLQEVWRLAGIQPVGGRGPAEIVHRLIARANSDQGASLSANNAAVIRRYLAIKGRPDLAVAELKAIGAEVGLQWGGALDQWLADLKASGLPLERLTLDTGFARPFGYYDGMLFEVRSDALGPDKPVAAGGRYDSLLTRLGGVASGAVGCMVRPARAWAGAGQ